LTALRHVRDSLVKTKSKNRLTLSKGQMSTHPEQDQDWFEQPELHLGISQFSFESMGLLN